MIKQLSYLGRTEQGVFAQALFGSAGAFEKTAGAPPFAELETGDEIRKVVSGITKKERELHCFVLVNALGAGEFFGSNINSDYFPWNALSHEGDDYGYKTFLKAHAFSHHKNKDPERAFGVPILSILNPRMKRVELIIKLDREKAKLEQADGIISRIDAGEFPDVSMGCKVPFDVCSICGNHSKTKDDYCFPAGTPILMANGGYKMIEEVEEGDEVITHRGYSCKVTHLLPSVAHDGLVRIEAFGFSTIQATPNHPFYTARTVTGVHGGRAAQLAECEPTWVDAEELRPNDTVFLPVTQILEETPTSEKLGWLLGFYLAEGCPVYSDGVLYPRAAQFAYHVEEPFEEVIKAAALELDPAATFWSGTSEKNLGKTTRVNSRKVAEWLLLHGGKGSYDKRLHSSIWNYGVAFARDVIRGWAEGDGSYDRKMDLLRVATSSAELAHQMQMLAAGCKVLSGIKLHSRETNFGHQDIWYVSFAGDAAHAAQKARPQEVFSKQSKLFFWKNYLCSTVKSVENLDYHGPVFNFEVEGDHSYVAGPYAVHNCKHMRPEPEDRQKWGPNKILPDGRRICVINTLPRFFDISFVFIGADKTAKVMAKLASVDRKLVAAGAVVLSADAGSRFYEGMGMEKAASVEQPLPKVASQKVSTILKEVPAGAFAVKKLAKLERGEPSISHKSLKKLSHHPLSAALGATAAMGIVLHPDEFQYLVLEKMGQVELSDILSSRNLVFRKTASFHHTDIEFVKEAMADGLTLLQDVVKERTAFGESFALRSMSSEEAAKNPLPTPSPVEHSLLDKISATYNGYRRSLMEKMSEAVEMVQSDSKLREVVLGDGLVNMFTKTASHTPVITRDSVAYMMGAHFSDRRTLSNSAVVESIAESNKDFLNGEEFSAQGF